MICIILAAGYATRLYPLTENYPKPLLKVGDKTIADRLIEDLDGMINHFILVSNHKFYDYFLKWSVGKNVIVIDDGSVSNEKRLGAVKDLELAVNDVGFDEDFLVWNLSVSTEGS